MNRRSFWIALAALSVGSAVAAYVYFPQAFSIVSLEISMTRDDALADAAAIAARDGLGPSEYRQAASFGLDDTAQTFVELEGGGKDAFTRMLRDGLYEAYTWRVRHFAEGETNETTLRFAPDGRPYGFVERMAEDAPGAALDETDARAIAEAGATGRWSVDLAPFDLVEHGEERRLGGRVDHTFTYERASPTVGDGRYRLRLVVSGDRLTAVTHFIQIPEAFSRRYESLRSANDTIGVGSVIGMAVLYVFGGIGIGLFVLLRKHFVIWRPALVWGLVIAGLQVLAGINRLPLLWMDYDTALPYSTFLLQQGGLLVAMFVGMGGFFVLSFMAAESLSRRAFGTHPQFWRLWGRGPGSSTMVLGRTVAGYLLVPVFFAYDVLLYLFATRQLGWWTPSDTLIQPDVLATYVPWLDAIANSLQAGFWEECLFRAVPIAGAALLGQRYGRKGLFIAVAFVVQAVIFGAGHAPYPTQPSFARPLELVLPSIGFGLLYLAFGLLPAIVLHFAFDVVWFALPIFLASAPGLWTQQAAIVVLTLVPLWVVLWRRLQAGKWTTLPDEARNAAWMPPVVVVHSEVPARAPAFALGATVRRAWMILGVVGLAAVVATAAADRRSDGLTIGRLQAAELARQALRDRGVTLDDTWRVMPIPESGAQAAHEFVSETAGEARRLELVGRYIPSARWRVRIATFEGDVVERAEEWSVYVRPGGEDPLVVHTLPDGRPGVSLAEDEARALAERTVAERGGLSVAAGEAREVSATPRKLDERTDWTFVFTDTTEPPLPQGEPRYQVQIAGDEVTLAGRFLHIPEQWLRDQSSAAQRNELVGLAAIFLFVGVLVAAAVGAVVSWSRGRFSPRLFVLCAALVLVVSGSGAVNSWPVTLSGLVTAQPLQLQVIVVVGAALIGLAGLAAVIGLSIGALPKRLQQTNRLPDGDARWMAISLGLVGAGAAALAGWVSTPVWAGFPNVAPLGTFLPVLDEALASITSLLLRIAIVLTAFAFIDRWSLGWSRYRAVVLVMIVALGLLAMGGPVGLHPGGWLLGGAIAGGALVAVYLTVLRADLSVVPLALAVMGAVRAVAAGAHGAFPGALAGSLLGAAAALLVGWWLFSAIRRMA